MSIIMKILWSIILILLLTLIGGTVAWFAAERNIVADIQVQNNASKEKKSDEENSYNKNK